MGTIDCLAGAVPAYETAVLKDSDRILGQDPLFICSVNIWLAVYVFSMYILPPHPPKTANTLMTPLELELAVRLFVYPLFHKRDNMYLNHLSSNN